MVLKKTMKRLLFLIFILLCLALLIVRFNKISMTVPTVSVVMPVYNREAFVSRAIDSILAQTYADFEFIIVDDGSTDKTIDILNKYASTEPRIRVLRNQQNCGISCSRNKGMDAARGKYIAVMDSDDTALPIRLEKLVAVMEENPELTGISGGLERIEKGINPKWLENPLEYKIEIPPEEMQFVLLFTNSMCNVCSLTRRQFVIDHQIRYNEKYISAEDYDFWKQILMKGGKLAKLSNPVTLVRFHRTNASAYYWKMTDNADSVRKDLFERFFEVTKEDLRRCNKLPQKCELLNKMKDSNAQKEIVNQKELNGFIKNICPEKGQKYVYLTHPHWNDFVIFEGADRAYRYSQKAGARFSLDGETLTMMWDEWPSERFVKTKDGVYSFTNQNKIKIKHPVWTDELIFEGSDRICRIEVKDCGSALKTKSGELSIKWDGYGTETFQLNPKTNIFEYVLEP